MNHLIRIYSEVDVPQSVCDLIEKCANEVLKAEKIPFDAFIGVTIVDDETIREMNAQYRKKDSVTDVLSFPMFEFLNGQPQEPLEEDPDNDFVLLGDMVLNYNRACQQAQEFGHSPERECGFLTVHSVLHLLGYDHEREEADRILMRQKEEENLSALGLIREV